MKNNYILSLLGLFIFIGIFGVNGITLINQSSQSGTLANLVNGSYWTGENFTYISSSSYYNISQISLSLVKVGSPSGNAILGLYTTNSTGHPQNLICNNTLLGTSISSSALPFTNFVISCPLLNTSTQYILTLNCPNCTGGNYITVKYQNTDAYTNGVMFDKYITSVSSWNAYASATGDMAFSIVGTESNATAPNLSFANITLVNNTYFNTSNIQINTTILNTSTNGNVNQTYRLYYATNGTFINATQYATNSLTGTANLGGLSNNVYKISLYANNSETNATTGNYTFTIDTTSPTISNNILSEYNYYNINGFNSSCSDTNLLYCNITINSQIKALNVTAFNFTLNGNMSYTINAVDLAGNTATATGVTLVNPYALFYFNSTGGFISNYTFGGENITGQVANFTIYNDILSLGSNTLTFSKLGYSTTDVTFSVTTSSNINLTTNITQSMIILNIYDRETFLYINTSTSTISLIANVGYNATTTTGQVNITNINFVNGDYTILASNPNYNSENIYFTYDNQETLTLDMYLLATASTDAGYAILQVVTADGTRINQATCSLLEWRPDLNSYISVAQGITNSNGEYTFNVEIASKFYKFSCEKAGITALSSVIVFTTTGTTLPLIMGDTSTLTNANALASFSYLLTNTSFNSTHDKINYTFSDSNNIVTEGCLNHYIITGINPTLNQSSCVSTTTGQIIIYVNRNETYNQIIYATAESNNVIYPIDNIAYEGSNSLAVALRNYHFDIILPLIFVLIGIVIGLTTKPANIFISYIGSIIGVWLSVFFVPTIISSTIAIFITLIALLLLWGGSKPK